MTWENAIPEDEVHIKVGGDAGGGSFKMAFQIAHVQKPNSKTNTVVFAMFHAKDSWANLKTALLQYKQQVASKFKNIPNLGLEYKNNTLFMTKMAEISQNRYPIYD